jgi:hypothetical protein
MKILELQGFSDFRVPAFDPDFRSFPGNFDRNLPENLPAEARLIRQRQTS